MPETVSGCPGSASIHAKQIIDSCMDKDCVEQLRVYLTVASQAALDSATSAKIRCAELLYVAVEVEPLPYKTGYYAVDCTFFYRIIGEAIMCGIRPTTITGISVFGKRTVLCGGTAAAKCFHSGEAMPSPDELLGCSRPTAVVEALDPIVLASQVKECCKCICPDDPEPPAAVPEGIAALLGEELAKTSEKKRLYVTLGQFSTVRLERDNQLTVPMLSYSAPKRECCDDEGCEEDPCDVFSRIEFPMQQFFPEGCKCKPEPKPCEDGK